MIFDEADGLFEFLRGTLPYYTIAFVPIIIMVSVTPVLGAHEFTVYRMQQFDLQGAPHGCRNSIINVEARTLNTATYNRKCIVARLSELSQSHYQEVIHQGAAGLLILLPSNISSLSGEQQQHIMELERSLLEEEVNIPIYFTQETPEMEEIYNSVQKSPNNERAGTAAEELIGSVTTSGYQMVITGSSPKPQTDVQIASIQGKLPGFGVEEQLPTVALVAHYDAFGIAPALSFGADSNGSGVAALLELARLLSHLYTSSRTHPRFNLLFLLSGGGKFNYQGSKKWIEDNIDSSEGSLLPDSLYTLCLDTIGTDDSLYLHVSKPPKEGSPGYLLYKELQNVADWLYPEMNVSMVHKKINLAEEVLAWEHERFSIRRLPAFTLSRLNVPKLLSRMSILDTRDKVDVDKLARNVKIIAEALARHMYNLTGKIKANIFTDGLAVQKQFLAAWIDYLSSNSRSAQLLASTSPRHPLVTTLEQTMARYLKEVRTSIFKPDRREPEVVFYEPAIAMMNAYRVKPAVFDLFLAVAIAVYLSFVYLIIMNFYRLESFLRQLATPVKSKQT